MERLPKQSSITRWKSALIFLNLRHFFLLSISEKIFLPLVEKEYIFDIFIKMEKDGHKQVSLAFRKLVWFQSMRFANNLFTEVIYDQVS